MLRILGMILLIGSVLLIGVNIVRFGSGKVASARGGQASVGEGRQLAAVEVAEGLTRTVKFLVVPAALLLVGGVLVNNTRRDDRVHELRADVADEQD